MARASDVTARTLRYYDKIGLLTPASAGSNGHRVSERAQLLDMDPTPIREVIDASTDPCVDEE